MRIQQTQRLLEIVLSIASTLLLASCGSMMPAGDPPAVQPTTIDIVPATATLAVGRSQRFIATVQNDPSNKGVSWNVSGTGCAGAGCGTIGLTGLYTAPAAIPSPNNVTITAASLADPSKLARATATIVANPTEVAVSPSTATIQAGATQLFAATVSPPEAEQTVTWSVAGAGCAGDACGTIDSAGKFTAPASVPDPSTVTVKATSMENPSLSGTAIVTLEPNLGNAKLSGQYAFVLGGYESGGDTAAVGSFTADGNGHITTGTADVTYQFLYKNQPLNGDYSYVIGPDNRGSMSLAFGDGDTTSFYFGLSLALESFSPTGAATQGRLVETDQVTGKVTTGFFVMQDQAAFSNGGINGDYAFGLSSAGTGLGTNLVAMLGRFTANGGALTAGQVDLLLPTTSGSALPFSGTYTQVDVNGRGQLTLNVTGQGNPSNFIFYVVSSSESLWMEAGGTGAVGAALQQSGGPFTGESLHGTSVYGVAGGDFAPGNGYEQNDVSVGEFQFDGIGNLAGIGDENYFGIPMSGEQIGGTYTLDANGLGRGEMNYACGGNPFYLVSPGKGFILTGCDVFQFGKFEPQTAGPFDNGSFSGGYALGTLPLFPGFDTNFTVGEMATDGAGDVSGTYTTAAYYQVASDSPTPSQTFTGKYSVDPTGRVTLTIAPLSGTTSNFVFYVLSPSKAVGAQMDLGMRNAAVNVLEK